MRIFKLVSSVLFVLSKTWKLQQQRRKGKDCEVVTIDDLNKGFALRDKLHSTLLFDLKGQHILVLWRKLRFTYWLQHWPMDQQNEAGSVRELSHSLCLFQTLKLFNLFLIKAETDQNWLCTKEVVSGHFVCSVKHFLDTSDFLTNDRRLSQHKEEEEKEG